MGFLFEASFFCGSNDLKFPHFSRHLVGISEKDDWGCLLQYADQSLCPASKLHRCLWGTSRKKCCQKCVQRHSHILALLGQVLDRMKQRKVYPNAITFNTAMNSDFWWCWFQIFLEIWFIWIWFNMFVIVFDLPWRRQLTYCVSHLWD